MAGAGARDAARRERPDSGLPAEVAPRLLGGRLTTEVGRGDRHRPPHRGRGVPRARHRADARSRLARAHGPDRAQRHDVGRTGAPLRLPQPRHPLVRQRRLRARGRRRRNPAARRARSWRGRMPRPARRPAARTAPRPRARTGPARRRGGAAASGPRRHRRDHRQPRSHGAVARLELLRDAARRCRRPARGSVSRASRARTAFPWRFWIPGDPTVSAFRWGAAHGRRRQDRDARRARLTLRLRALLHAVRVSSTSFSQTGTPGVGDACREVQTRDLGWGRPASRY